MRLEYILLLLTAVNLLNYVDRGLVAGAGTMIKGCVPNLEDCSAAARRHPSKRDCADDDAADEDEVLGCTTRCMVCGTQCHSGHVVEQTGFGMNDFDLGMVQSSFMVGYMLGSFIFSSLASKGFRVYRLLATGMTIWTCSALVCAASGWEKERMMLWLGRVGSGVGEAALATTVLPHLDDIVPESLKGRYMSIYFSALPVGTALGFVFAGIVSESLSWEWTFFLEACCMPGFILVFLLAPSLQLYKVKREQRAGLSSEQSLLMVSPDVSTIQSPVTVQSLGNTVWREVLLCLKSTTFFLTVMGLSMYTFTTAGLAFYMPQFLQNTRPCDESWDFTQKEADLAFGGMTMVAGFFGVLAGGLVLDYFGASSNTAQERESFSQAEHALRIGFRLLLLATSLLFLGIFASNVVIFFLLAGVGVFTVLATTTPSSRALLGSVPTEARPVAMALSNLLVHLFGDVPSPILIGAISDAYSPRIALLAAWFGLVVACGFWFLAWKSAANMTSSRPVLLVLE